MGDTTPEKWEIQPPKNFSICVVSTSNPLWNQLKQNTQQWQSIFINASHRGRFPAGEVEDDGNKYSHQVAKQKDYRPKWWLCIISPNKAMLVENAINIIKSRQLILSVWAKDIFRLTQEASSEWATMYYGKQRIMHNYGQLSRGRGGGNKWSCRELATRQSAHWALSKEEHTR